MKAIYIVFVVVIAVIIGQYNAKIGLALAGVILLGSAIVNANEIQKLFGGKEIKTS